jgi:hypothetical protein
MTWYNIFYIIQHMQIQVKMQGEEITAQMSQTKPNPKGERVRGTKANDSSKDSGVAWHLEAKSNLSCSPTASYMLRGSSRTLESESFCCPS